MSLFNFVLKKHSVSITPSALKTFFFSVLFCAKPAMVLERTKIAVQEGRLYRCLVCRALCELSRAEEKWPSNNSAMCSPYFQNFKKIQDSNLSHQGNHDF